MSAEYKKVSKAKHYMEIAEPVVIEKGENTRKVIIVGINDAKQNTGETVSITLVHQRKKGTLLFSPSMRVINFHLFV